MYNVYKQIEAFYSRNPEAENIIQQAQLEKYFRRLAWKSCSQLQQKKNWTIIACLLTYMLAENYFDIQALYKYDFIQMFRSLTVQKVFESKREDLTFFISALEAFLSDWQSGDEQINEVLTALTDAEREFYSGSRFAVPQILEDDLEYADNIFLTGKEEIEPLLEQDEADRMNAILERLMSKIAESYRSKEHWADLNRAMEIFLGPVNDPPEQEDVSFWLGFWDYFFFDYHLINDDKTPLMEFYFTHYEELNLTERMVVKTLLGAEFRVFVVDSVQGDYLTATDMFSGDNTVMPCPDFLTMADAKKKILYGHVNATGTVMMSNITAIPASEKLQKRIQEELHRAFQAYQQYQVSDASMKVFLQRHAAAVRHIINIMAGFAQLKVVSISQVTELPGYVPDYKEKILPFFRQEVLDMAAKIGFSYYSVNKLGLLYDDFSGIALLEQTGDRAKEIAAALFLTFAYVNSIDYMPIRQIMQVVSTDITTAENLSQQIREALKITQGDPRYLTEEGFVHMLYMNLS